MELPWELINGETKITESEDTFTNAAQFEIRVVEALAPVLVHVEFLSVDQDSGTAIQDALGSTLHDDEVAFISIGGLVHTDLVLVGGVEGNLGDLAVLIAVFGHTSYREFNALEQGRFRGIPVALSLQDRLGLLALFKLGAVTEHSDTRESHPG